MKGSSLTFNIDSFLVDLPGTNPYQQGALHGSSINQLLSKYEVGFNVDVLLLEKFKHDVNNIVNKNSKGKIGFLAKDIDFILYILFPYRTT